MKSWKLRVKFWLLGNFQIPIIGFTRPKIISIDHNGVEIRIRLGHRTKNHLKSMYFGAMAVGADAAAGLLVYYFTEKEEAKFSFSFKRAEMEFLKRAETDVIFICTEGHKIKALVHKAIVTKQRINEPVVVNAFDKNRELVATFQMTLSLKVK